MMKMSKKMIALLVLCVGTLLFSSVQAQVNCEEWEHWEIP
jgi:hypothetical protein